MVAMMSLARMQKASGVLEVLNKRHQNAAPFRARCDAHQDGEMRLPFGLGAVDTCLEGGLVYNALHEIRCSYARDAGAALGVLFSLLIRLSQNRPGKVLWVIDPACSFDSGALFPAGLEQYGFDFSQITFVTPRDFHSAMWAADEASTCQALTAVIFQVKGNPLHFDMTATRRLMLRARENGVFTCILRQSGEEEASAAATRWHVGVQPSQPNENHERGIGQTRHVLTLERNRSGQTGQWLVRWNHKDRIFENGPQDLPATHSVHRIPPPANRPYRPPQMGEIMDFERTP